jgi:Fe-S cluster biogenesis protein NfuA
MEKEIIYILEKIRPYIQNDGGDIEFVKFENGIVYVRMHGACVGCMELDTTMKEGVEALLLEEVPGVIAVEVVE